MSYLFGSEGSDRGSLTPIGATTSAMMASYSPTCNQELGTFFQPVRSSAEQTDIETGRHLTGKSDGLFASANHDPILWIDMDVCPASPGPQIPVEPQHRVSPLPEEWITSRTVPHSNPGKGTRLRNHWLRFFQVS